MLFLDEYDAAYIVANVLRGCPPQTTAQCVVAASAAHRAVFITSSAVVNRLPLRAHKEKTEAEPMRIRRHTFAGPDRSVRGMPVLASKSVGTSVMGSDVSLSSDVVSVYHPGAIPNFTISALLRAEYQNPSMG